MARFTISSQFFHVMMYADIHFYTNVLRKILNRVAIFPFEPFDKKNRIRNRKTMRVFLDEFKRF